MSPNRFELSDLHMESFFFIAHLFDRILLGKQSDPQYRELVEAFDRDLVLEVHFFNDEQEVYATRVNRQLVAYKTLCQPEVSDPDKDILTRYYKIEENKSAVYTYNTLVVREFIDYEDDLAYVKQTMLYKLEKRVEL